ncbi:Hpt domain-containing protein [Pontibacter sp. MBLB2868]|uniref:Hpt domain-containing protein n=1 Tax=Pontibacter sp. MBLB2868 TaxID=3451555 RepID=UPI003F7529C9
MEHFSDAALPLHKDDNTLYNLDYLHRMSGGDNSFINEMIRLFIKQVPLDLEKLKVAEAENDMVAAKQVAHKLKSSISMVGAEKMLLILKNLEITLAESQTPVPLLPVYSELLFLFNTIKGELELLLD